MQSRAIIPAQTLPRNVFNRSVPKILEPLNNLLSQQNLGRSGNCLLAFNINDGNGYGISGNSWHPWVNKSNSWFPNLFPKPGSDQEHVNLTVCCYLRNKAGFRDLGFNLEGLALKASIAGLDREFIAPFDKDGKAVLEMLPSGEYSLEIVSLTDTESLKPKHLLSVETA